MSTRTETTARAESFASNWVPGAVGGVAGALAMGALVVVMNEPTLAVAIPSLYTLTPPPSLPMGFAVHAFHGAVLGLVFAGIVSALDLDDSMRTIGAGLAWGVLTWVGLAALVMPLWLDAVGSPASPPFPNFAMPSLLWHLVYGLVLGVVFVGLVQQR